jgi:hypothetical protein
MKDMADDKVADILDIVVEALHRLVVLHMLVVVGRTEAVDIPAVVVEVDSSWLVVLECELIVRLQVGVVLVGVLQVDVVLQLVVEAPA